MDRKILIIPIISVLAVAAILLATYQTTPPKPFEAIEIQKVDFQNQTDFYSIIIYIKNTGTLYVVVTRCNVTSENFAATYNPSYELPFTVAPREETSITLRAQELNEDDREYLIELTTQRNNVFTKLYERFPEPPPSPPTAKMAISQVKFEDYSAPNSCYLNATVFIMNEGTAPLTEGLKWDLYFYINGDVPNSLYLYFHGYTEYLAPTKEMVLVSYDCHDPNDPNAIKLIFKIGKKCTLNLTIEGLPVVEYTTEIYGM